MLNANIMHHAQCQGLSGTILNASIMHYAQWQGLSHSLHNVKDYQEPYSMQVLCTMHNGKDYHAPCTMARIIWHHTQIPPLGKILVSATRHFNVHSIASVSPAGEEHKPYDEVHMNKPSGEVRRKALQVKIIRISPQVK